MKTSLQAVQKRIDQFLHHQRRELEKIDFVVGVSRGGLIPATLIATAIDKPLLAVYIDRQDRVYIDRPEWISGKRLLLVDDIVRTGSTLKKMLALLEQCKPTSILSFTLCCLKDASVRPTWTKMILKDRSMPWDHPRRS
ncbi:phosphoribosyltransferase [Candidatus Uhrbacteria bacterium]|nr:phosphoribosyltransferase [Candidatus Uhrbacteria bacterium]